MTFYIDHLRLVPKTHAGSKIQASTETKLPKAPEPKERPVRMIDYGFDKAKAKWLVPDPELQKRVVRIPFIVKDESGIAP